MSHAIANAANRRQAVRHRYEAFGKFMEPGGPPRDCRVCNISDGGVRIHVDGVAVPDEFVLLLDGENERRRCEVVWRLGHEIGARFSDQPRPGFAWHVAGTSLT